MRDGGDEEGGGVYEGGWEGAFYIVRRDRPCYSKISSIPQGNNKNPKHCCDYKK